MLSRILTTAAVAGLMTACAPAEPQEEATPTPTPTETVETMAEETPGTTDAAEMEFERFTASGTVIGAEGEEIGTIDVNGGPNGALLRVVIDEGGLTTGWHGIHLHQVGDCSDVGEFKASGGHVGLIEGGHGLLNPEGPEGGDLPNIWASSNGSAGYEAYTVLTTGETLMDEDGSALIIHESQDDHISQPIGGAGARVGCAVISD